MTIIIVVGREMVPARRVVRILLGQALVIAALSRELLDVPKIRTLVAAADKLPRKNNSRQRTGKGKNRHCHEFRDKHKPRIVRRGCRGK